MCFHEEAAHERVGKSGALISCGATILVVTLALMDRSLAARAGVAQIAAAFHTLAPLKDARPRSAPGLGEPHHREDGSTRPRAGANMGSHELGSFPKTNDQH
jgi:hypothetical protein